MARRYGFGIFVGCECCVNTGWMTTCLDRAGITEADRAERAEYSVSCNDVKLC